MTVDIDRRLQAGLPSSYSSRIVSTKMATTATSYGGRLSVQSRPEYLQQGSGLSSSSGDNNAGLNRFSTLESSNNDNNKARIQSFSTSNHQRQSSSQHHRGRSQEKDFSNLAQIGGGGGDEGGFTGLDGASGHRPTRSESVGRSERGRSKSVQGGASNHLHQRSTSTSAAARSKNDGNSSDNESVIIEEKRRRLNGDGYTLHRYLRGRLLGRGGFAKVYLCTALDTNKNYAVKIVPKANLVKARARQKVRHTNPSTSCFPTNCLLLITLCSLSFTASSRDQNSSYTETQTHLRIQTFL